MTLRDTIAELRDGVLTELASRGTPEGFAAIERISEEFPEQDWTRHILRAKQALAQGTWMPMSPREVIALRPPPTRDLGAAKENVEPELRQSECVLFSWIHLSDIHIGHGDRSHQLNQKRILDALARDIEEVRERGECPAPNALFVTGDIAFSGKEEQYTEAKTWLTRVAKSVDLDLAHVFVVPGNHDVDRSVDKDKSTSRTVNSVRAGHETLDDILHDAPSRLLLAKRMAAYTTFAGDFGPNDARSDRLYWTHSWIVESGIKVRLIGLNTALLAAGNDDKSKLSLGEAQLQLLTSSKEELTFLLTHHPLHWLSDRTTAEPQAKQHVDIHLSGHVHEAESMSQWGGAGTGILRVVAGAAHNEAQPAGVPAAHGYNWGAVVQTPDNKVVARVWPWRWANTQDFRLDVQNVPKGKTFAEHELLRLRLNVMLPKAMGLRSSEKQRPR